MKETNSLSQKLKQFVLLFFPIFVTQMSLFAMSFFVCCYSPVRSG
ncbi:multidrug efflux protein [Bacillus cereus]|nr:multidrug efflux protein [Bacillus cereus]